LASENISGKIKMKKSIITAGLVGSLFLNPFDSFANDYGVYNVMPTNAETYIKIQC